MCLFIYIYILLFSFLHNFVSFLASKVITNESLELKRLYEMKENIFFFNSQLIAREWPKAKTATNLNHFHLALIKIPIDGEKENKFNFSRILYSN